MTAGPAPRLRPGGRGQLPRQSRRAHRARHRDRPGPGGPGQLRGRRGGRPHLPLAVLLPQRPAARRPDPVRAVQQRAHRGARQPGGQQEVQLPGRRRRDRRRGPWQRSAADQAGIVVAGLRRLAGRHGPAARCRLRASSAASASPSSSPPRAATCGRHGGGGQAGPRDHRDRRRPPATRRGPPRRRRGPPLLACNGIGTPLEALAPFTSVLDPAITVVRFDVPGVGGSPAPRLPYTVPVPRLARRPDDGPARLRPLRRPSASPGAAASPSSSRCSTRAAAGGSCSPPPRPGSLMIPAHPRGPAAPGLTRAGTGTPRTPRASPGPSTAAPCATIPSSPRRSPARTPRPASRRGYLYQLAASAGWTSLPCAAAHHAADADPGRRRRPDHPAGQRAADGRAAAGRPAARLSATATSACSPGPPSSPPLVSDFLLPVEPGASRAVQ